MPNEKKRKKNPILALILSAILPGLGQIYNNQLSKGFILVALNFTISFLISEPLEQYQLFLKDEGPEPDRDTFVILVGYVVAGLVLWIYSILDAKKTADLINKEQEIT